MLVSVLNLIYRAFLKRALPRHFNTGRKAMTEVVTALLIFVSVGIFLAHAFDAYRLRCIGPGAVSWRIFATARRRRMSDHELQDAQ